MKKDCPRFNAILEDFLVTVDLLLDSIGQVIGALELHLQTYAQEDSEQLDGRFHDVGLEHRELGKNSINDGGLEADV